MFPQRSRSEACLSADGGHGITVEQGEGGLLKVVGDARTFTVRLTPRVELSFEIGQISGQRRIHERASAKGCDYGGQRSEDRSFTSRHFTEGSRITPRTE